MRKINNKGYMLVEIIMAFAITFALVYFIMDLVINLKNKNDDLMVSTLVTTDQTIITNKLMDYAIAEEDSFSCETLLDGITENSVKYGEDVIDIVNEYSVIDKDNVECSTDLGKVSIVIPIDVKQMDEDYDVVIDYKYDIGDMVKPECEMSADGSTITVKYHDNEGSGVVGYYFGTEDPETVTTTYTEIDLSIEEVTETKNVSSDGTYYFGIIDKADNTGSCSVLVDTKEPTCTVSVRGTTITGSGSDDGSGLAYYGWDSSYSGDNETTITINKVATYTYYVKDNAGNTNSCKVVVKGTTTKYGCNVGYTLDSNNNCYYTKSASIGHNVSGICNCKNSGGVTEQVSCALNSTATGAVCSCRSGYSVVYNGCTYNKSYYCNAGYRNGAYCYFYGTVNTSYVCSDDTYTKINNSYCYKIG